MTRVIHVRDEPRQACAARRARVRVSAPVALAVLVIGGTGLITSLAGLPARIAVGITALVAVLGACIARRTVGNVAAGLLLAVVRPYAPGERVQLAHPDLGAPVEAEIVRVGFVATTLCTSTGVLIVPNTRMLRSPGAPISGA